MYEQYKLDYVRNIYIHTYVIYYHLCVYVCVLTKNWDVFGMDLERSEGKYSQNTYYSCMKFSELIKILHITNFSNGSQINQIIP